MGMVKIIPPDSWDFGEAQTQLIKVSSRGLLGSDKTDLIKRAGDEFAHFMSQGSVPKGMVPLHNISHGAWEKFGSNRNGDCFDNETCRDRHTTFVKYGRYYRHHQNRDPAKSYGIIKASHFNEKMGRVSLLIFLNGTKEAAEENGGLVADRELEKLNKGEDIPTSMSCKVAFDVCNSCGNKAKNRSEYCLGIDEGGHCKHGGCRHHLAEVRDDGHMLGVFNPGCTWFDSSGVLKQADYTAYGARADYLDKAASFQKMGGAELAEHLGVQMPPEILWRTANLPSERLARAQLAQKLATMEKSASYVPDQLLPFSQAVRGRFDHSMMGAPATTRAAQALAALADVHVILPIEKFAAWVNPSAANSTIKSAKQQIPTAYEELINDETFLTQLAGNRFTPCGVPNAALREWAHKTASNYALTQKVLDSKLWQAIGAELPIPVTVKSASDTSAESAQLARDYAIYQLSALQHMSRRLSSSDLDLTLQATLLQNHAS